MAKKNYKKTRVAVLRVAGTNCDQETMNALTLVGATPELLSLKELLTIKDPLSSYGMLVIPGGFSYGDDLGAGKVFANELRYKLKIELTEFISSGRLVLGICNGFQVLIKTGFLPGWNTFDDTQHATLSNNDSGKYEDRWVYLKTRYDSCCVFSEDLPSKFYLPVAHGEGKFLVRNNSIMEKIVENRQIVFQYTDKEGALGDYPWNPNGSLLNIAALCNERGNVMGMMPHPERYWSPYNHPQWTRQSPKDSLGLALFSAAANYAARKISV